ncbi:class A beta-lactamase-related serine hydrolase [Ktedonosporobacter rubrisoli]|uniref:Class A beta-lactamase-related serine hydrolase n=1 Tax=Ktedonosporobacter rubrisoli TaxID=2509675 RepID=A0A4P6JTL1_KTERU|nr:serine hydrolase domain-containing protein [Ktedonosporobacter rubrisoli]QBD78917.1 class A beta-lactamase-related serine hydrolase [Ktedonosporobacter rubrisoli]
MSQIARRKQILSEIDAIVARGIQTGAFPGATLWIGWQGETLKCTAYGKTADQQYGAYEPVPVTTTTLYDLASLTKVVATTCAIMQLVERGVLRLSDRAIDYLPRLGSDPQKASITLEHLLTHTSGLPGPMRLYQFCYDKQQIMEGIYRQKLAFVPGTACLYDDLSFILLSEILQVVTALDLHEYTQKYLFGPVGMRDTMFRPPAELKPRIAPAEYARRGESLIHGEVHDENAWTMGGIAGHAGLFSTIEDLASFCQLLLYPELKDILSVESIKAMTTVRVPDPDEALGLGWIINAPYFMGELASASTFGHTGFTGTSLLINRERQLALVFLSNRVCPTRHGPNLNPYRVDLANALAQLIQV